MAVEPIRSQSTSIRDAPGESSNGDEFEHAKELLMPLLIERLDLPMVMQLPSDELSPQIVEVVTEILLDLQVQLKGPEHDEIVRLMVGDLMDRRAKIQDKKFASGSGRNSRTSMGKRS